MKKWTFSLGIGHALVACLAIGVAGSTGAATLDFEGSLSFEAFFGSHGSLGPVSAPGSGQASLVTDGEGHLVSITVPRAAFGPWTTSLSFGVYAVGSFYKMILTVTENQTGEFSANSGGAMGLSGLLRVCLVFDPTCNYVQTS